MGLLVCALCAPRVGATNGLEPIGVGQNAISRGGVDVAVGDTAFSQISNPATLSFRLERELDLGVQCILPRIRFRNALNQDDSRLDHIEIPCFALAIPVNDRFSWGFAVHGRAGLATDFRFRYLYPPLMKHRHTSALTVPGFVLSAAWKLNERLSLGAGVRAEIMMLDLNAALGPVNLEIDKALGFGFGFQVGGTYRATDRLTLAAAYHSPTWFGDVRSDELTGELFPLRFPLGGGAVVRPRLPQKIILGASYDITQRWKVMGEARWVNYGNSFLHDGALSTDLLDVGVPLNHMYRDVWVFAVGSEYRLTDEWTLSGGYNFGNSPARGTHLLPGTAAGIVEHHLTAGLRYDKGKWFVGVGWVRAFRKTLSGEGPGRLPIDALPIARDYGAGSSVSHSQDSIVVSLGFRF